MQDAYELKIREAVAKKKESENNLNTLNSEMIILKDTLSKSITPEDTEKLINRLTDLEVEIVYLKNVIDNLDTTIDDQRHELEDIQSLNKKLEEKDELLNTFNARVVRLLEEKTKLEETSKTEKANLQDQLDDVSNEVKDLQENYKELENINNELNDKELIMRNKETEINNLKSMNTNIQNDLNKIQIQKALVDKEKEMTEEELKKTIEELKNAKEESSSRGQLNEKNAGLIVEQSDKIKQLEKELKDAKVEIETASRNEDSLKTKINTNNATIDDISKKNTSLRVEIDVLRTKQTSLENYNMDAVTSIDNFNAKNTLLNNEKQKLEEKLLEQKKSIEEIENKHEETFFNYEKNDIINNTMADITNYFFEKYKQIVASSLRKEYIHYFFQYMLLFISELRDALEKQINDFVEHGNNVFDYKSLTFIEYAKLSFDAFFEIRSVLKNNGNFANFKKKLIDVNALIFETEYDENNDKTKGFKNFRVITGITDSEIEQFGSILKAIKNLKDSEFRNIANTASRFSGQTASRFTGSPKKTKAFVIGILLEYQEDNIRVLLK